MCTCVGLIKGISIFRYTVPYLEERISRLDSEIHSVGEVSLGRDDVEPGRGGTYSHS